MNVVAWVSRHKPLKAQKNELNKMLGNDCKIIMLSKTFRDVNEVLADIHAVEAKYAVVVLPLSMIAELISRAPEITWLWAEMEMVHSNCQGTICKEYDPKQDVILTSSNYVRHLRFQGFKKIIKIEVCLESWR
ncbi:MAG: hypothetical protein ACTSPL_04170 [Candidatus Odinarchaeia archaeon]